jgi:DNA-binding IclR family transcriptional regulator
MAGMLRMRSKSSVHGFVARLRAAGLVVNAPDKGLAPTAAFLRIGKEDAAPESVPDLQRLPDEAINCPLTTSDEPE